MRESSHLVRIEKHCVEGELVVLTFSDESETRAEAEHSLQRPVVFVQHGLGSRKERHLDLCLRLAEAGFLACSLDARHHGDRATQEMRKRLSDIRTVEFLEAFTETIEGTGQDIAAAATYFGTSSYGLIGHSMGGFIALQTTLSDSRVSFVVSIAGALILSPPEGVQYPPQVADALRQGDPLLNAAGFWPRPVLLLHGTEDETVPLMGSVRLHQALLPNYIEDPARLALIKYPGMGHELSPEMADDAINWIRRKCSATAVP